MKFEKKLKKQIKNTIEYYKNNIEEAPIDILRAMYKDLLQNCIPKKKIEEIKDKIEKAMNLANNCIEKRIVIADSDSLNFGRKQAHNYDIELIRELLEEK